MASNVGIEFLEKVSRLLSRQNKKPVLKPNRPLVLKDAVANRKLQKGGKETSHFYTSTFVKTKNKKNNVTEMSAFSCGSDRCRPEKSEK